VTEIDIRRSVPGDLAALLQASDDSSALWSEHELIAIFQHQLSAPLVQDLLALAPQLPEKLHEWEATYGVKLACFRDLFSSPVAPRELLELVKEFAKSHRADSAGSLPQEIAAILYLAAISAALVYGDHRITALDDEWLRPNLEWAQSRSWIDSPARDLFQAALKCMVPEV
jgi:hypothetical protein